MIIELAIGAVAGGLIVYFVEGGSSAGVVAAVKAEVAKIEVEVVSGSLLSTAKADALSVIARLKAVL
jgi:hypothetical protein